MEFLKNSIKNIENYKIYHLVTAFTLTFIILFFNGIYNIHFELKRFSGQNREFIIQDIENTISSWIMEKAHIIENSA